MKRRFVSCVPFFMLVVATAASAAEPLAEQVTIYRDNFGVPHIVGETEEATFFGYGYAQAEDHLESMMLQHPDAQGRRAEIQGFAALGDGYLHFIPYEYRWDGDYLQRLLRTKEMRGGKQEQDGFQCVQDPGGVCARREYIHRGSSFADAELDRFRDRPRTPA